MRERGRKRDREGKGKIEREDSTGRESVFKSKITESIKVSSCKIGREYTMKICFYAGQITYSDVLPNEGIESFFCYSLLGKL